MFFEISGKIIEIKGGIQGIAKIVLTVKLRVAIVDVICYFEMIR